MTTAGHVQITMWSLLTIMVATASAFGTTPLVLFSHQKSAKSIHHVINGRSRHHNIDLLAISALSNNEQQSTIPQDDTHKLQTRLLKNLRQISLRYSMLEHNDKIMVCISGGKDSATLLYLLLHMQMKLASIGTNFDIVAVHLNQMQPGYDGTLLVAWLEELGVEYKIVTEDTYSIVTDKTPENKAYCSLCSRLRRGILYSIAHELGCNKIALGHHGDDSIQTLLLNMIHGGSMKAMPARYYSSSRDIHVIRPLITCVESDIAQFAQKMQFPILPCNLCGSQDDLHRGKTKLLVDAMDTMNPNARKNMIRSLGDVKPTHLLDENLREACGLDKVTGSVVDEERARLIGETKLDVINDTDDKTGRVRDVEIHNPSSFIESLL